MKIFPKNRAARILTAVILAAVLFLLFDAAFKFYKQRQGEKRVEELANELKRIEQEIFDKKAADKIGGKTPQETLDLFIVAVEKGDYELASRYFVVEKQEEELKSLQNSPKKNIENIMSILKRTVLFDKEASFEKQYDDSVEQYGNTEPKEAYFARLREIYREHASMTTKLDGYDFDVSFLLYPSGNWKIEKI